MLKGQTKKEQKETIDIFEKQFVREFLETNDNEKINSLLNNLKDYGDNAIRYFRFTKYIYIRGGGYYIDLEPRRSIEINDLLNYDSAKSRSFKSKEEYIDYISNISEPQLPWETKEKYIEIIAKIITEIKTYENKLKKVNIKIKEFRKMQKDELKNYVKELRIYRKTLQNEQVHKKSQNIEQIELTIKNLENIFKSDNRPILLEKLSTLGLHALNDALKIQPNYPVGDDNEPTFTAPANTPDIECFYNNFNAICEVTMLTSRNQWYNEGQPVMRHLRNFENKYPDKPAYCLFIAPKLHRDTLNTFWTAIKYEYEGVKQKIIPLSINDFVTILEILLQIKIENKFLKHNEISRLYDKILVSSLSSKDARQWIQKVPNVISTWSKTIKF